MVSGIVEEYKKKRTNLLKNFFSNLTFGRLFVIAIFFLILLSVKSNKNFTYITYGFLVCIILYLIFKPSKEIIELDAEVVKNIAQEYLDKLRMQGKEIAFDSKVEVMLPCQRGWKDDLITGQSSPTSWDVGFVEYVHGSSFRKEGVIEISSTGIISGLSWHPLGYSGRENTKVTKIVPVGVINTISGGTNPSDYKPA